MENIAASITRHGNVWTLQKNKDMESLYESLHVLQIEKFKSSVKSEKGFKYGPSERHRVDVKYFVLRLIPTTQLLAD
jgi:hypothetical protein